MAADFSLQLMRVLVTLTFVFLSLVNYPSHLQSKSRNTLFSSSVWCEQLDLGIRSCHFRNVCYESSVGFLFILTHDSEISGLKRYDDLKNLKLSSVGSHPAVNMKVTMIRKPSFSKNIKYLTDHYFAIHRFKPDNFMHVLHDDLIPLFLKFREICLGNVRYCANKYSILFVDDNEKGPFIQWYRALSMKEPMSIDELAYNSTICFSSIQTGVKNSSFFQYGFRKPQGPIKSMLSQYDVMEFRDYFLKHFEITIPINLDSFVITVISRSVNRKIINEQYIFQVLSSTIVGSASFGKEIKFYKVDLILNKTEEILFAVSCANILVGMHGAETFLSLFLPDFSIFIELFPFGIFKQNVSPIYSLSSTSALHFTYLAWHNMIEENSITHPEYPVQFGGINSFLPELKHDIYRTKYIPAVECCENPYYLFRMYQDTFIDDSFLDVASATLDIVKNQKGASDVVSHWYFPGAVYNISCSVLHDQLHIVWRAPFNLFDSSALYNVSVMLGSRLHNLITEDQSATLYLGNETSNHVKIWIFCQAGGKESVDTYTEC